MGDWSNNLEYEQREYYGHFYDTDEDVHEEETEEMTNERTLTTVEILKEMAFTATETQRKALEDAISALSENKKEWIPISSINEIPKEGAYWVTFEYENGYRETSHIGWDKFHERWDDEEGWALDDEDYIIAYMPYFEPKPYEAKAEKGGK